MQRADLTVKEADEACQLGRWIGCVLFTIRIRLRDEYGQQRTAEQLRRTGIAAVLLDQDSLPFRAHLAGSASGVLPPFE
jgi:hypothetical protein